MDLGPRIAGQWAHTVVCTLTFALSPALGRAGDADEPAGLDEIMVKANHLAPVLRLIPFGAPINHLVAALTEGS